MRSLSYAHKKTSRLERLGVNVAQKLLVCHLGLCRNILEG